MRSKIRVESTRLGRSPYDQVDVFWPCPAAGVVGCAPPAVSDKTAAKTTTTAAPGAGDRRHVSGVRWQAAVRGAVGPN